MVKKKKTIGKIVIPKELVMEAQKPRYNAYQGGIGIHKTLKLIIEKRNIKKTIDMKTKGGIRYVL